MSEFKHTHYFLAQKVKLLDQDGDKFYVEYPDGSKGWSEGQLVPMNLVEAFIMGNRREF